MGEIFGMIDGHFPEPKRGYSYLSAKEMTKMKHRLRMDFADDSDTLFNSAWRELLNLARNQEILDYDHLKSLYESIVSYKVNNPRSKVYIYG